MLLALCINMIEYVYPTLQSPGPFESMMFRTCRLLGYVVLHFRSSIFEQQKRVQQSRFVNPCIYTYVFQKPSLKPIHADGLCGFLHARGTPQAASMIEEVTSWGNFFLHRVTSSSMDSVCGGAPRMPFPCAQTSKSLSSEPPDVQRARFHGFGL